MLADSGDPARGYGYALIMWSDRDDEDELPAQRPSVPAMLTVAGVILIAFAVLMALAYR